MANYKLIARANLIPIEEAVLADGTDKVTVLDSNIDRDFGADVELTLGTAEVIVHQEDVSLVDTDTLDNLITGLNATDDVKWIFVKLKGGGELSITWGTMTGIGLWNEEDWSFFTLGDSQGINYETAGGITFSAVSGTPTFDIVVGKSRG